MPDAFYRLLAIPNGIALIGLGFSLWQVQRRADAQARPAADSGSGACRSSDDHPNLDLARCRSPS